VVETIRLESGHTLTGIVGSNPTLSAISGCPATAHESVPKSIAEDWVEAQNAIGVGARKSAAEMRRRVFCMALSSTKNAQNIPCLKFST
jgi:hypothetical protein